MCTFSVACATPLLVPGPQHFFDFLDAPHIRRVYSLFLAPLTFVLKQRCCKIKSTMNFNWCQSSARKAQRLQTYTQGNTVNDTACAISDSKLLYSIKLKMFRATVVLVVLACAGAFAPTSTRTTVRSRWTWCSIDVAVCPQHFMNVLIRCCKDMKLI